MKLWYVTYTGHKLPTKHTWQSTTAPDVPLNCVCLKRERTLILFPANGTLEFIPKNILGLLPKKGTGNQFIIAFFDWCKKLSRAVLSLKTNAHVASGFHDHCIVQCRIPAFVLMDTGCQLASRFFKTIFTSLGLKQFTITPHQPHFYRQRSASKKASSHVYIITLPKRNTTEIFLHNYLRTHTEPKYIEQP